jgi:MFS family permease
VSPADRGPHPATAHPFIYLLLIVPFGVMSGYLTVSLAYLLTQEGLSVEQVAAVVALSYVPQTWKFLWAPIADTTLTRKTWYLIGAVVSALGIFAMGAVPAQEKWLPALNVVVLLANFAVTFLAMSVESLMAYGTPEDQKGRAGGWFQAGNLGGNGIGGGAGLWMAQVLPAPWMAGAALAVCCLLCAIPLLFLPDPKTTQRRETFVRSLQHVWLDLWAVAKSRPGMLALLICFMPLGTGAVSGLWSAVAGDWHASANTVALATGVVSGLVSAFGCLVGGYACDRMDRKAAYAIYGLIQAACAVGMALAPRTELMYIIFTTLYSFTMGLTYAAFSAVVLEAIGHGAAATKYNVFASLSNMPIAYMIVVDGWAQGKWGSGGMLHTEAVIAVLAALVFTAAVLALRPGRTAVAGT